MRELIEDFDHHMSIEGKLLKQTEAKTQAEEVRAQAQAEGNRIALDEGEKRFETAHDQLKMATDSSLLVLATQKKTQLGRIATAATTHDANAEMIRKSTEGVKNQTGA